MNWTQVLRKAEEYQPRMSRFLRDMIAIPSESTQEEALIHRIRQEMETVPFDRIEIDAMGNIYGFLGQGEHLIAMDAHIDTVGIGDRANWTVDPYQGYEDDEIIMGRGASDQEGGMAALVYGARIMRELNLLDGVTVVVTGTVQEEDCDGLCWDYILSQGRLQPEFVVSTEPTAGRIYRGQRGRMEIKVTTRGVSAHGSAPERGDNAIYKMAPILQDLQALHERLRDHDFLGKGSLTVSEIFSTSPSRCAVADGCSISIDRRLTWGETAESALQEIRDLPSVQAAGATVELYRYERASWTGLPLEAEAYFPTWLIPEDHPVTQAVSRAYTALFGRKPVIDKWTFSTNGVSIMGRHGIPCIGFGPGHEEEAHAPNEKTWKRELVQAAALYAVLPTLYLQTLGEHTP
ncbi:MAG: YgeY family selenium metabolism-linked hydrolase [Candidatus Neomarinimicrobiota bacterium]|nr:MAG: YgeY family selenium metabolism-linked hydrolase [Candidatus Neomarinimicrobiota bacterium]